MLPSPSAPQIDLTGTLSVLFIKFNALKRESQSCVSVCVDVSMFNLMFGSMRILATIAFESVCSKDVGLDPRCSGTGQLVSRGVSRSVVSDCGVNCSFLPAVSGPGSISFGQDWSKNSDTAEHNVCFGQGRG